MFNFTALLGAQSESPASSSLLEFEGGIKVLVDVGWDESFDASALASLEKHVPTISIILLTHATTSHLGAFAHCCKHFPQFLQIPVYATNPVIALGRTLLQDLYASTPLAASTIPNAALVETSYSYKTSSSGDAPQILLQPPTLEEIATYFSLINPLKYSQPHQPLPSPFSPPLNGLTVTAYNAGHTLGGTIWQIQHGMESVVYAVDWNQSRENVFSGAAWLGTLGAGGAEVIEQLRKPTALICSSKGVEKTTIGGGYGKRDVLFVDMIRSTIAKGGSVLVPVDTSARVLEIAYLLDHAWRDDTAAADKSSLRSAKLYLAGRTVGATMRYARSMLEWMDERVVREFESEAANVGSNRGHRRNDSKPGNRQGADGQSGAGGEKTGAGPFDFKFLRLLERQSTLKKLLSRRGPKVILASDQSLAWGFSKDVLQNFAQDANNLVILTDESTGKHCIVDGASTGATIWKWYNTKKDGVATESGRGGQKLEKVHTGGQKLVISDAARVPLEGNELLVYQQYLATQRQLRNVIQLRSGGDAAMLETSADAIEEASSVSSSSSEESDDERQGKALNISSTMAQANKNKSGLGKEILGINVLLHKPGVYDYDVRGKKGREAMFPFVSRRKRQDDFGELIRPEDYLRAEERDEIDGQDMLKIENARDSSGGQKRKWEDSSMARKNGRHTSADGENKRRRTGDGDPRNTTNGTSHETKGQSDDDLSDGSESESEELPSGPTKIVYKNTSVQANFKIAYVDFSGLHDQRSLTMLIPLIQPRKLVLVGGSKSETKWLANECAQKLRITSGSDEASANDIFTPAVGETIMASMDTNAWTIKLSDALVRRLHWQNVRGLGVVTLMGKLAAAIPPEEDSTKRKKQKLIKDESANSATATALSTTKADEELPPILDVLPTNMAAATRTMTQPIHVGDLRLADLRKILQSTGYAAEFRGEGTLVVDNLVAVRKTSGGRIEVEGAGIRTTEITAREKEGSFIAVRKRIYEGLAIIAGG